MFVDLVVIGLSVGIIYGLVALSISLVYSGLDIVHFAHGEMYMLGAFMGLFFYAKTNMAYPFALVFAVVGVAFFGIVVERVFYRRLTSGGGGYTVAGMGIIICGFGMAIFLQNLAYIIWDPMPKPFPVDFGTPLMIGDIFYPRVYMWIVIISVSLMVLLHVFMKYTRYGLAMRAVAKNKDIAFLSGINVPLLISITFGIGCGLAAAGGVLIGPINYVEIYMGYFILIKGFAAAVVGGFGNLPGAVIGGLIVGVAEALGSGYLDGDLKDIYAFMILILVLMIKPSGLFGVETKVKA